MTRNLPTSWSPRLTRLLVPATAILVSPAFADPPPVSTPPAGPLPLRNVVLFSTGVGYFGRTGEIDGDAQVDLQFRAPQVPDILKSLVIRDPGGPVQPVTYSIADWLRARPQPADIKVAADGSVGAVLRTFQGANLHIERPSGTAEGRLVSVSQLTAKTDWGWGNVEAANLLTDAGLRAVRLDDATAIRLTDPVLNARFRSSLEHLAASFTAATDDGLRTLSLHYHGKGQRVVSAGYLQETPAWKTTYRLILDADGKAFLQGWAIVENPTDEDWNNVNLTMVSGQPVSFIQDLYAPIYVTRPTVPPMIIGSSQPQTYGAGYGNGNNAALASFQQLAGMVALAGYGGLGPPASNQRITQLEGSPVPDVTREQLNDVFRGVQTMVAGSRGKRGELFAYAIDGPVTLHSGDAAMIPILGAPVKGEPVSVVTAGLAAGELNPANGFLLENTSGAHLQGGPITVYAGGIYAGDALTQDVSPGETRLISYASDLDLNGRVDRVDDVTSITKLSALAGVLTETTEEVKTGNLVFKNKSDQDKTIILQLPEEANWALRDPKQSYEKSEDLLRFRTTVKAGETLNFAVPFVSETTTTSNIWDADDPHLVSYLTEPALSPELKAKLVEVETRRAAIADTQAQRAVKEKALSDIGDDQNRIRGNMQFLDHDSGLYKEYVAKFEAQEAQVETLHEAIARLLDQEASEQKDLRAYVDALSAQ